MSSIVVTIHIIVCFILIIAILLQSGKSADLAGAFGGGGSQTVFGPRGVANLLTKMTTTCAVLFMLTSLGLWMLSATGTRSAVKGEEAPVKDAAAVTETKKEPVNKEAQSPEPKKEKEQKSPVTKNKD